jgi:glycosyltransferase involved in cell wall biosynthesis
MGSSRTPSVPLHSAGRPAAGPGWSEVRVLLDAVRGERGILPALRRLDDLLEAAARGADGDVDVLLDAVADRTDTVTALTALQALGALPGERARAELTALLVGPSPVHREHAAWALGPGPAHVPAVDGLVALVSAGGFAGMLAQRTLERWAREEPAAVSGGVRAALGTCTDAEGRSRLVETLGLTSGPEVLRTLLAVVRDDAEDGATRAAAAAALADISTERAGRPAGPRPPVRSAPGLTVAQLFLHADIDAGLTHAGQGDTGGIATLLVQLGDALVQGDGTVCRALTLSRSAGGYAAPDSRTLGAAGHHYLGVPLPGRPPRASAAWPLRVAARRGIRQALLAARPVDVIHLRMADVGSLAAAEVADELGIRVVLTVAPDPHALVEAREQAGTLTRANFAEADLAEHLVFRDRLLRGLARRADHLVLFPRPTLAADADRLLGIDVSDPHVRATVVGEGVDLRGLDGGRRGTSGPSRSAGATPALADLDAVLGALPPERRHLPLLLSVGRLHPVKGMATLVQAWSGDPTLAASCNLLVVGGDLDDPSEEEQAELDRIRAAVPGGNGPAAGLLLPGHRPNPVVREWMAAIRTGRPGLAAPHGAYVSASLKEEFGIAIVEAVASGLVVVAPGSGGPATFVEDGLTGVLTDTTSTASLAAAVQRALVLAADEVAAARAESARERLRQRVGIGTMARALEGVYRDAVAARPAAAPAGPSAATSWSGGAPMTWTAR